MKTEVACSSNSLKPARTSVGQGTSACADQKVYTGNGADWSQSSTLMGRAIYQCLVRRERRTTGDKYKWELEEKTMR